VAKLDREKGRGDFKMQVIKDSILRLRVWKDTSGQDLVEYALAAGLVAVAAVAAMPQLSATVNNVFSKIGTIIDSNVH
jgi:pilus assembly protein Flp/PilA